MNLQERLRQLSKFYSETTCAGGKHLTVSYETAEAAERIAEIEAALKPFAEAIYYFDHDGNFAVQTDGKYALDIEAERSHSLPRHGGKAVNNE